MELSRIQDAVHAEVKEQAVEDDDETSETNEKLKALRAEKTKLMMEQAARKSKLEKIIEEMLEHEAELAGKTKPTEEEARKLAEQVVHAVGLQWGYNGAKQIRRLFVFPFVSYGLFGFLWAFFITKLLK